MKVKKFSYLTLLDWLSSPIELKSHKIAFLTRLGISCLIGCLLGLTLTLKILGYVIFLAFHFWLILSLYFEIINLEIGKNEDGEEKPTTFSRK